MIRFAATVTCQYDTPFALFSAKDFDEALDWVRDSGFDSAELCISNYRGIDVPSLRAKLDSRGLGCATISTGQARLMEDISLIHPDSHKRTKAQKRLMEHIDAAQILNSKVTIGLLRGIGSGEQADEQKEILKKSLVPCIAYAHGKGVRLLLEAINRYETALLNSAHETADFIREMNMGDTVSILWDLFHANIEDADYAECIEYMGPLLGHVHIADSNRMFPGFGHTDFHSAYKVLKSSGYDGTISFECHNLPDSTVVKNFSGTFIKNLRALEG